jgi:hypothetical protein
VRTLAKVTWARESVALIAQSLHSAMGVVSCLLQRQVKGRLIKPRSSSVYTAMHVVLDVVSYNSECAINLLTDRIVIASIWARKSSKPGHCKILSRSFASLHSGQPEAANNFN